MNPKTWKSMSYILCFIVLILSVYVVWYVYQIPIKEKYDDVQDMIVKFIPAADVTGSMEWLNPEDQKLCKDVFTSKTNVKGYYCGGSTVNSTGRLVDPTEMNEWCFGPIAYTLEECEKPRKNKGDGSYLCTTNYDPKTSLLDPCINKQHINCKQKAPPNPLGATNICQVST